MNRAKFLQTTLAFGGLHPPFAYGGKFLVERDVPSNIEHSDMLLRVALSDCESDNPFQDLGTLDSLIFSVMAPDGMDLETAIRDVFERFTDRFDLSQLAIKQDHDSGEAMASVTCRYTPFNATVEVQDLAPLRRE